MPAGFNIGGPSAGNNSITIHAVNLPQVIGAMEKLRLAIRQKMLMQVVRQGATILTAAVKAEAPITSGRLHDSIVKRRERNPRLDEELWRVIVARNRRKVFYAHLVEFEHIWVRRRNGRTIARGHYSGNPFMTRAFNSKSDEVSDIMLRSLRKKVIRESNKISKSIGGGRLPRGFGLA